MFLSGSFNIEIYLASMHLLFSFIHFSI